MYVVYIYIHHLLNKPKMSTFAYNSDGRKYIIFFFKEESSLILMVAFLILVDECI